MRIVSIDGGEIRGILALEILIRIEDEWPRWREPVDVFVGTSTWHSYCLGAV